MLVTTVAAGLFAGAAVYVTAVEHPARLECGPVLAIKEFGPSYRRAAVMQGVLAVACLVAGGGGWGRGGGGGGGGGGGALCVAGAVSPGGAHAANPAAGRSGARAGSGG